MSLPAKFTYPFRYTPCASVVKAADSLIARISASDALHAAFSEGKMLGVLVCDEGVLYAFSGLVNGKANIEGFVPPIFDYTDPDGYFRTKEREIAMAGEESAAMSRELQDWLFRQYVVRNAKGESMNIRDVFALRGITPPGGTGECAAPKLLNHAYVNGYHPRAMGEFWYGKSPRGKVREQGRFYPSCTGKCGPLLSWMMQGLDVETNPLDYPFIAEDPQIIYHDDAIVVVNKPSGMLSVPGKTAAPCLLDYLSERFGQVYSCHRLDQDTSGVMVYARNLKAQADIMTQFENREVSKSYRARLDAGTSPFARARKGTIALPLMLDYYDRPCQMVDESAGKKAVTDYEVIEILPNGEIEIRFFPKTGRTHQLRVHSAHPLGLGHPIKGDCLYGAADGGRLYLHAESLEFRHPVTGEMLRFEN